MKKIHAPSSIKSKKNITSNKRRNKSVPLKKIEQIKIIFSSDNSSYIFNPSYQFNEFYPQNSEEKLSFGKFKERRNTKELNKCK